MRNLEKNEKPTVKLTASESDIINLIKEDHKPLKKLIRILKDSEKEIEERIEAYAEFAPLLVNHAKSEEQSLYVAMKQNSELREEGLEGDVEHGLADQLIEEIRRTEDDDLWSAKVKVLAELVEHHIQEEEDELLPDYRNNSDAADRVKVGQEFLRLKTLMMEQGNEDSPSENGPQAESRGFHH